MRGAKKEKRNAQSARRLTSFNLTLPSSERPLPVAELSERFPDEAAVYPFRRLEPCRRY